MVQGLSDNHQIDSSNGDRCHHHNRSIDKIMPPGQSVSSMYLKCIRSVGRHSRAHRRFLDLCAVATRTTRNVKRTSNDRCTKLKEQTPDLPTCLFHTRPGGCDTSSHRMNNADTNSDSSNDDDADLVSTESSLSSTNEGYTDFFYDCAKISQTSDIETSLSHDSSDEQANETDGNRTGVEPESSNMPNHSRSPNQSMLSNQARLSDFSIVAGSFLQSLHSEKHYTRCFPTPLHFEFRHWVAGSTKVTRNKLISEIMKWPTEKRRSNAVRLPTFFKGSHNAIGLTHRTFYH